MKRLWNLMGKDDGALRHASLLPWRAWSACLLITCFALFGLGRGLQEPSTGWRFGLSQDGHIQASSTDTPGNTLNDVTAIAAAGRQVVLTPDLVIESSGLLHLYAAQDRFHAAHREIWALLQQPVLELQTAQGAVRAVVRAKTFGELGLYFWLSWGLGLLSLSVGLAAWVYRPSDSAAAWYATASVAYAYFMLLTACTSSRLLTQHATAWAELHQLAHATGFLMIGALCMLLLRHPTRLPLPWLPPVMLLWSVGWMSVDVLRLVPSIAIAYRLPSVMMTLLIPLLFGLQWHACRHDPVKRAQIKWFGLVMFASFALIFVGFSSGALGHNIQLPLVAGLGAQAMLFLGLVPLVTRLGLFQLERWWAYAWLWFLGGLLVVVLDLALVAVLPLSGGQVLTLALAAGGWLYFPLRQEVWLRLSRGALPATHDILPDIVALIASKPLDPEHLGMRWRALWDKACQPLRMASCEHTGGVHVRQQGQEMWIPGADGLSALCLFLPERGQRLFRPDDERRATEIVRLVHIGMAAHQSFERGAREERQRIASDLHDDLGAILLAIAQSDSLNLAADMARQAMAELRLSVRGLAADTSPLSEVLADWRAESVSRLMAASIQTQWSSTVTPADLLLPASRRTQLTRILREAVSNVIRHSGAGLCRIHLDAQNGMLALDVQDNGRGMVLDETSAPTRGMGLTNIAQRARKLGGQHELGRSELGGVHLRVGVPIEPSANIHPS